MYMQSGNEASYNIRVKLSQRYIAHEPYELLIACWAGSYAPAYVSEILVRRSPGLPGCSEVNFGRISAIYRSLGYQNRVAIIPLIALRAVVQCQRPRGGWTRSHDPRKNAINGR